MEMAIRTEAKADARTNIDVTLGEYIPLEGSEIAVDFDSAGLISWARSKFGVELNPQEIREGGAEERAHVKRMLIQAAEDKIESADLDGLDEFVDGEYGLKRFSAWAKEKLTISVSLDELKRARKNAELPDDEDNQTPLEQRDDATLNLQQIIMKRARQLYRLREIEYPVDFAMDMTMQLMRVNPSDAANQLVAWANQRYALGLDVQTLIKTPPSKVREMLKAASEKFVDGKLLEQALTEADACKTDDALDAWLQKRFARSLPDNARYLEGEEREQMVRSQVENILRAELLMFERTILLEVLDSLWKDHLYSTDQLRDSISFRAFSQLDPRIEFKREASRLFKSAMQSMRDRVIDYIFKAKISPSFNTPAPAVAAPRATPNLPGQPPAAAPGAVRPFGSSITGPGLA
jgi:preprotein translocase subunit SecA